MTRISVTMTMQWKNSAETAMSCSFILFSLHHGQWSHRRIVHLVIPLKFNFISICRHENGRIGCRKNIFKEKVLWVWEEEESRRWRQYCDDDDEVPVNTGHQQSHIYVTRPWSKGVITRTSDRRCRDHHLDATSISRMCASPPPPQWRDLLLLFDCCWRRSRRSNATRNEESNSYSSATFRFSIRRPSARWRPWCCRCLCAGGRGEGVITDERYFIHLLKWLDHTA